ncbi:MAG: endonuclease/exonuclease/phosphatase family protein [Chloroflexota bacterium]
MLKSSFRFTVLILVWIYACGVFAWFVAKSVYGDTIWWLALLNALAAQLFLPLPIFLLLGLIQRKHPSYLILILPGSIFIWLYGALFLPQRPVPVTNHAAITVMTFNVWGNNTPDDLVQVIRAQGLPDIVALQELRTPMADILVEELGNEYPYQAFRTSYFENGVGILSKYPMEKRLMARSNIYFFSREFQIADVQIDDRTFTIYNIHPESSNIFQFWRLGGDVGYQVDLSFKLRGYIMKEVAKQIQAEAHPIILTGDFNFTDQNDAYQHFSAILKDAHREVGWGFGHTYPSYVGNFRNVPIPPKLLRIDMIWYSDHFTAIQNQLGSSSGESDHLPVIATLKWRQ